MDDLYRELIIDRFKNPLYRGKLEPNDITFEDSNPLCGDHIRIDLRVGEDGRVTARGGVRVTPCARDCARPCASRRGGGGARRGGRSA